MDSEVGDASAERTPALRGNLFDPQCPTRRVLDRIGDKWTVLVVEVLAEAGPLRFTDLRERVRGVTPKVLTQALRALERDGLLEREVFAEVPPRVEYRLTSTGHSLRAPLAALREWAEANIAEILAACERYDRRPSPVAAHARRAARAKPIPTV